MTTPNMPAAALAALQRGNLIEAIKAVRKESGLGLKEAKDQVDQYLAANPQLRRSMKSGSADAGQFLKIVLVLAIAVAVAAWYLLRRH